MGFIDSIRGLINLIKPVVVALPATPTTAPASENVTALTASPPDSVVAQGWSKSLDDCHAKIRNAYPAVEADFCGTHEGYSIKKDYTYRSPEFQFELFKKGREPRNGEWVVTDKSKVVTQKDGSKPSHHNVYPAQALDMYIMKDGKIIWPNEKDPEICNLYTSLGKMWEKRGLVAGATWKFDWKDWDHIQVDYKII